jgi:hypothetical protein
MQNPPVNCNQQLADKLPDVIRRAAQHAREVGGREHVKANRHERVGHFVTTLRRLLDSHLAVNSITTTKALIQALCDKAQWYDAGVLATEADFYRFQAKGFNTAQVKSWVAAAAIPATSVESELDDFDISLAELSDDIPTLQALNTQADAVCANAERAATELEELMVVAAATA